MSAASVNLVVVVVVLVVTGASLMVCGYRPYPDPGPDIPRWQKFCGTRPPGNQCCPNRVDTCTAPILDTLCYCDDFCDRDISDCCPDFWTDCQGLPPQPFNVSTTPRPPYASQYDHLVCVSESQFWQCTSCLRKVCEAFKSIRFEFSFDFCIKDLRASTG